MNERIKELARQAGSTHKQNLGVYQFYTDELEKFAQLIVAECLDACSRANEIRHFIPPTQEQVVLSCMREMEQHFGVSND